MPAQVRVDAVPCELLQPSTPHPNCSAPAGLPAWLVWGAAGPGELRVKSAQLFREYWKRPEATAETFDEQGYFMTGEGSSCLDHN